MTMCGPRSTSRFITGPDNFFTVAVRTAQDEKTILPGMVSTLRGIDPNLGVFGEMHDDTADREVRSRRCCTSFRRGLWAGLR